MILINGIPKHGTHALLKAVELLGVPIKYKQSPGAVMGHVPYPRDGIDKHLLVIRHPKNAFISLLRMYGAPLTEGTLISNLQSVKEEGSTYVEMCGPFLPWLDEDICIVRFEDLIGDGGETLKRIAEYMDAPYLEDAYPNLPGFTATWTGELSDYTKLDAWTKKVDKVWKKIGGLELQKRLGYAD